MDTGELYRYYQNLNGHPSNEKDNLIGKQSINKTGHSAPAMMLMTIVSSAVIVLFLVSLAVSRYYLRRKHQPNSSSYSVTRYYRRPLASTSCDSLNLSPVIKESVSNQVLNERTRIIKNSFSWPQTTMLHREQQQQQLQQQQELTPWSSTMSSCSLSNSSTIEHFSQPASLTFGLRWDEITRVLFVRLVSARDLFLHRRQRQPTLIDSYVRIELLPSSTDGIQETKHPSMRTHIVKKNAYPVYDELFQFDNPASATDESSSLVFTVSTYDTFTRDEIVGEVIFPLRLSMLNSTEMTFTHDITPRYQQLSNQQLGQMLVSLCYQPADSAFTIIVLKASNLPRLGTTRLINPYFKIYMFYKEQRIVKKRSTIKRTTQSPVYNECFTFQIPDNDMANIRFDFVLFDYDRHRKHEPIGTFSLGHGSNDVNRHWSDVCQRQISKQIAQWYQLQAFNQSIH